MYLVCCLNKVATLTFILGLTLSFVPVATGCNSGGSGSNGDPGDAGPDTGVSADATPDLDGSTQDSETLVFLESGMVRGVLEDGVVAFKSIPYAAPPIGERRWRPPERVEPWDGELRADTWPPPCLQVTRSMNESFGQEDCLYLNVWRTTAEEVAPVLVFIHGGGNMFGSTSEEVSGVRLYSGAGLARASGAVVVTIQYRLNILGYFSHPDLDEELTQGASGNWGLRDQIGALKWVKENIHAFGGDPERTLLFGESGGAASVCGLVATPAAAGLFSAALMQSGGCGGRGLSEVRDWSAEIIQEVGCGHETEILTCMREASGESLALAASLGSNPSQGFVNMRAGPTIDGALLPQSPLAMFASGESNQVPMVFGVNAHETAAPLFGIVGSGQDWNADTYEQRVRAIFGPLADDVLAEYTVGSGPDQYPNHAAALIALTTDLQFICPNRTYARTLAENSSEPVYRYLYSHAMQGGPPGLALLGAGHGFELFYIFQHMADLESYNATPEDFQVQEAMSAFWVNLAADADPGSFAGVTWPIYDPATDPYLDITAPLQSAEGLRTQRCDFWESLLADP